MLGSSFVIGGAVWDGSRIIIVDSSNNQIVSIDDVETPTYSS